MNIARLWCDWELFRVIIRGRRCSTGASARRVSSRAIVRNRSYGIRQGDEEKRRRGEQTFAPSPRLPIALSRPRITWLRLLMAQQNTTQEGSTSSTDLLPRE